MLNKFLCRMWGHQFVDFWIRLQLPGSSYHNVPYRTNICKHCGVRK